MEKQKLGQEPAFPTELDIQRREFTRGKNGLTNNEMDDNLNGMTKRFYAATEMAKALIPTYEKVNGSVVSSEIVKKAYAIADELLKQEEK